MPNPDGSPKPGEPGYGQLAAPGTYATNQPLNTPQSHYARRYASAEDQARYGNQTNGQNAAYRNKEDKFDSDNKGLRTALQDAGDWFMGTNRFKATPGTLDPNWDRGTPNEVSNAQAEQNAWLKNAMLGNGPSVAEKQLYAGSAQAQAAAASQAASARGGDVALANRGAALGQTTAVSNASRDAAMLRASEQQAYGKEYTGALQQERLAQLQAQGLSLEAAQAQLQAETAATQTNATVSEGNAERHQKGTGSALMALAALSDIAAKEDVQTLTPQSLEEERRRREEDMQRAVANYKSSAPARSSGGDSGLGSALGAMGGMLSDKTSKAEITRLRAENGNLKNALDAAFPERHPVTMPVDYHPRAPGEAVEDLPRVAPEPGNSPRRMAMADANARAAVAPPNPAYAPPPDAAMASDFTQKEQFRSLADALSRYDRGQPQLQSYGRFGDVRPSSGAFPDSHEAYAPVDAVSYRYRPEAAARMTAESPARTPEEAAFVYADKRAPRAGIIAQQLEKSPAFRPSVVETPAGKAVVRDRALSTALAQGADLDKRLRDLESRTKRERASVEGP